jgi:hypothetical protein
MADLRLKENGHPLVIFPCKRPSGHGVKPYPSSRKSVAFDPVGRRCDHATQTSWRDSQAGQKPPKECMWQWKFRLKKIGASEGIRTLDIHLGKVTLYQTELRSLPDEDAAYFTCP